MNKHVQAYSFEHAFKRLNRLVLGEPEYMVPSRIGESREILGVLVEVTGPRIGATFASPEINRIDYDYAEKFWEFMISGGTDAKEAFKEYPNVAKFIDKPKSSELPENFNTFYGPRIVAQLPAILKELEKPNSRRAVIQILQEQDQVLLDANETLEYPCTDSITFSVRDDRLNMHTHMRSQNVATVMQLDFFLMHKLFAYVADKLDLEMDTYTHTIVSAHIYERDVEYVRGFLNA
ncbi:thymidylate synthase [Acinetobacter phage Acj9]|uniref:Gp42 dCMP hydroxymethylase n=1 Tax=Acinetobacter phage Acj9 TaxID=760939 RepID=E5EPM3_9CAUD|nr:thymidylate synthase [Acinetobacter phage Acj9]ADG59989.1 gp42 dCMP hydroxymethylase [Acinetobacter phage Acj9]